jgi:acetyl-CoA carboxylase biotin carboxyl carrier protein
VNLTDEDVDEILRLLEKSPYDELKLVTDRFTLELKAGGAAPRSSADGSVRSIGANAPTAKSAAPAATDGAAPGGEIVCVYPPLPGTFYRAPSPGAEPFTEVGSKVTHETILGLVETMKLMNSVVAGCEGEIEEICIDNGVLVEKEDVLIRIRVAAGG